MSGKTGDTKKRFIEDRKQRISLTLTLSGLVFIVLLLTLLIVALIVFALEKTGGLNNWQLTHFPLRYFFFIAVISLFLGTILSFFFGKFPLQPLNNVINAMNRLAAGDFGTRLSGDSPLSSMPFVKEMIDSFNTMASELENTEMLRSDFINNFSHEFKTPITSISGFAKLLRNGDLSEREREEYLEVIEKESIRLSDMATNILNLTKLENQTILTDVKEYNLSEQLRSCVLLLENKWTEKNLEIDMEPDEYSICANEEQLNQVWVNLLDNAIKFSPEYGTVTIGVDENADSVEVKIMNAGEMIPEEKRDKLFTKFYQADESHTSSGNGIGLPIVKRVVELHGGNVSVESNPESTCFTVRLPKE